MTETPARASAVIIGAGIVGNSLVHHLAQLGWRDLVLVDKGPMPNPGGSTGHASNFIFPIEYSRMMFELTEDSTAQYKELGVFTQSGGIEVARTPERMIELRRRCSQAKAWGIPAELVTPGEVNKLVPYLDESVILGGAHFPTVGVVDSLRAGTLMREEAQRSGALQVLAGAEVLGIDTTGLGRNGRPKITSVRTTAGEIETSICVVCCGVWSPRIARLAGAHIPLTPIVHQMISVGPIIEPFLRQIARAIVPRFISSSADAAGPLYWTPPRMRTPYSTTRAASRHLQCRPVMVATPLSLGGNFAVRSGAGEVLLTIECVNPP